MLVSWSEALSEKMKNRESAEERIVFGDSFEIVPLQALLWLVYCLPGSAVGCSGCKREKLVIFG